MRFNEYTTISPMGDAAIRIEFNEAVSVQQYHMMQLLIQHIEDAELPYEEIVPSFQVITILFNPLDVKKKIHNRQNPYQWLEEKICIILQQEIIVTEQMEEVVEIPVCYGGEFGPDLEEVANYHGITPGEVIQKHTGRDYFVYMLGFAPGFPYLGGLDESLATPRKQTPRLKIEAGSVGIAGSQTGVYSIETPGGWQIIGRTPTALFTPEAENPTLLRAGVWIRFYPISIEEYHALKGESLCQSLA